MASSHRLLSRSGIRRPILAVAILLFCVPPVFAEVSTTMFQSNMVMQREMAVPVFGRAAPGEAVSVTFRGQTKSTKADGDGRWQVKLDPMEAGGPFEMAIKGTNTLSLSNVMVGEVWLCAGQSNMGYPMRSFGGRNLEEAAKADLPNIRIITMGRNGNSGWQAMSPEVCLRSSATAYYFGRDLHAALDVPVGLIVSSSPGTSIVHWITPEAADAEGDWTRASRGGVWYYATIRPVIPYAIRGAIWYQGESDTDDKADQYKARFLGLIRDYRENWSEGDFPFLYVQIASFGKKQADPGAASRFAQVREAQTQALTLPKTAMAVTIDIGDVDWHPKDKWDVGKRLALPALRLVYGEEDIAEFSGPMIQSAGKKGSEITLHFNHAQGGLVDKGENPLQGFAVCGGDGQWHWAKGTIQDDSVVLTCDAVQDPVKARYAWADCPIATPLYNKAGLPAVPFEVGIPMKSGISMNWGK